MPLAVLELAVVKGCLTWMDPLHARTGWSNMAIMASGKSLVTFHFWVRPASRQNKERASNARSVAPAAVHRANELPCASARTSPNESPRCTYTPTIHLSVHRRRREPLTPFKLHAIDPSVWKSLIQDSSKKPVWMPSCGANDLAKVFGGAFAKVGKNESLPILPKVFAHD